MGKGTGDLYIQASCRLLTKTYEVQDLIKYIAQSNSLDETGLDINLPSKFECSLIVNSARSGYCQVWVVFNNAYRMFKPDSGGKVGIVNHSTGQWIQKIDTYIPTSTDTLITLTYDNGNLDLYWGSYHITRSDIQLTKITQLYVLNDTIKELKVKPL